MARPSPRYGSTLRADLRKRRLGKRRVLAAIVSLPEKTLLRIGNQEYANRHDHCGLTTLRDDDVTLNGSVIRLHFVGKGGQEIDVEVQDGQLSRIVEGSRAIDGEAPFQYVNGDGVPRTIDSSDVSNYLYEAMGQPFTAKDFRTWGATVRAARWFLTHGPCNDDAKIDAICKQGLEEVAAELAGTVATAKDYYVHPAVESAYRNAELEMHVARHIDACDTEHEAIGLAVLDLPIRALEDHSRLAR